MEIVSYRGPGMAGGVSPALTQLVSEGGANHLWWHLDEHTIRYSDSEGKFRARQTMPKALVDGHYRYCNEFLWPVMHDLGEYARYRSEDRAMYERFNRILAREIASSRRSERKLFAQDYQLAILPKELRRLDGPGCGIFWHIPWPKSVPQEFLEALIDIAKGMLSAQFIGFHTNEYCANFFQFVTRHIAGTHISLRDRTVIRDIRMKKWPRAVASHLPETRVIAAPLGLDLDHWSKISRAQSNTRLHPALINTDFVLSVDRADYTKGVIPRLEAIAAFFNAHPDQIGRITFAQLCTRTRAGIESFDNNWYEIQRLTGHINARFGNESWLPILNLKGPLNASALSLLYNHASLMLVSPLRDGLNLTAKEYIACQTMKRGALALSPYCGAYEELGEWAIDANPYNPQDMSQSIFEALNLADSERRARMTAMLSKLRENTLNHWCNKFRTLLEPQEELDKATANSV